MFCKLETFCGTANQGSVVTQDTNKCFTRFCFPGSYVLNWQHGNSRKKSARMYITLPIQSSHKHRLLSSTGSVEYKASIENLRPADYDKLSRSAGHEIVHLAYNLV